ncbi:dynactin subunit 6-like [Coccinella septempunctata]|uniref:dynactin subunit 6-like n=1 Tax=Coccinella septempunctata TaxID=41139 RepID=UPI001D0717A1|nr:dynactin subunit 6-like [Coccinella septempunctata]
MNKSRVKIFPGSSICAETMLIGDISFGNNCVVHPYVQILAVAGPIIFGENCLIEERVQIIHRGPPGAATKKGPPLVIGSDNTFEVGCRIEARKIGNNNIFESKSLIGNQVTITDDCIIGAGCKLREESVVGRNSIVYGSNCKIREVEHQLSRHPDFMDTVSQILYRNHRILKVTHRHQSSRCHVR